MILWLPEEPAHHPARGFKSSAGRGNSWSGPSQKVSALDFICRSFCIGIFVAACAEIVARMVTE